MNGMDNVFVCKMKSNAIVAEMVTTTVVDVDVEWVQSVHYILRIEIEIEIEVENSPKKWRKEKWNSHWQLPSSSTCRWPLWTRFISTSCGKLTNADGYRRLLRLLLLAKALPNSSRTWIDWDGCWDSCFFVGVDIGCCCVDCCLERLVIGSWMWWLGPATSTLDDSSLESPDDKGDRSSWNGSKNIL